MKIKVSDTAGHETATTARISSVHRDEPSAEHPGRKVVRVVTWPDDGRARAAVLGEDVDLVTIELVFEEHELALIDGSHARAVEAKLSVPKSRGRPGAVTMVVIDKAMASPSGPPSPELDAIARADQERGRRNQLCKWGGCNGVVEPGETRCPVCRHPQERPR